MHVERRQPVDQCRVGGLGNRKHGIAPVEVRAIAQAEPVPGPIAHPLREHSVEQEAARGREHHGVAPPSSPPAERRGGTLEHGLEIGQVATKPLRAEIVGHSCNGDLRDPCHKLSRVAEKSPQHDTKPISGKRATRQFPGMGRGLDDLETLARDADPVRCGSAPARHGKPLRGDGMPVLETRVAHVVGPAPRKSCQLARHPRGVGVALAHAKQHVLTGAGGAEPQLLVDLEVIRSRANAGPPRRIAGPRRLDRRNSPGFGDHGAEINTVAKAAIPSRRPVKPSFSVVVALTLTASADTPSSAATRSRIASR